MAPIRDILGMTRLKDVLEPGERVVHRVPISPLWPSIASFTSGLVMILSAALILATRVGDSGFDIDLAGGIVFAATSFLTFASGILLYLVHRVWAVLVTDRRLLQRTLPKREKFDQIRLADIDEVRLCRLGDGLFIIAGDRKITLPCKERPAARIREAMASARKTAP